MCAQLRQRICSLEMTTLARNQNLARMEPAVQRRLAIVITALKLVGLTANHRTISVGVTAMLMQNVAASQKSPTRNALSMCVAANMASAA